MGDWLGREHVSCLQPQRFECLGAHLLLEAFDVEGCRILARYHNMPLLTARRIPDYTRSILCLKLPAAIPRRQMSICSAAYCCAVITLRSAQRFSAHMWPSITSE